MIAYQVNLDYERQTGEDNPGRVKEVYLVENVITPSEAENIVLNEIKPFIYGDCDVKKIQKREFFDVFPAEHGEFYYEAKVEMITIDGDKETRKAVNMLIQGNSIHDALKELKFKLDSYDCEIITIKKSPILDILKTEETK